MSNWKNHALVAVVAMVSVYAVACGGDEEAPESSGESQDTEAAAPEASESIDEFAERFAAAGAASAAQDCETVKEFNRGAGFILPCSSETAGDYASIEITDSEEFQTAGIVDYTSGQAPDGATAIAAVHEDGRFRLIQSLIPSTLGLSAEQVGTEPEDEELRTAAALTFVEATRDEDCEVYFEIALTFTQDQQEECRAQFDPESQIQPHLAAAPEAEPEPLGGTEAFGFHELVTGENYRVLVTLREYGPGEEPGQPPYVVLSYRSR